MKPVCGRFFFTRTVSMLFLGASLGILPAWGTAWAARIHPPLAEAPLYVDSSSVNAVQSGTCGDSDAPCASIQSAIDEALPGTDIVVSPGTYCEQLTVDTSMTIQAENPNAMPVIDGGGNDSTCADSETAGTSVMTVGDISGDAVSVTLTSMVVQNGDAGTSGLGGGVFVYPNASLEVDGSVIQNNVACNSADEPCAGHAVYGGGVYSLGTTSMANSSVVNNYACGSVNCTGFGGGLYQGNGSLTLSNVTVAQNAACETLSCYGAGGGLDADGGSALLVNSTVSSNVACFTLGFFRSFHPPCTMAGAGVATDNGGSVALSNSIVSQNEEIGGSDCQGSVTDGSPDGSTVIGNNLAGDSCSLTDGANGDALGSDAQLGALQDNGGDVPTMAPDNDSPAVGTGDATTCMLTTLATGSAGPNNVDARGWTRSADTRGGCDMGAYDTGGTNDSPSRAEVRSMRTPMPI